MPSFQVRRRRFSLAASWPWLDLCFLIFFLLLFAILFFFFRFRSPYFFVFYTIIFVLLTFTTFVKGTEAHPLPPQQSPPPPDPRQTVDVEMPIFDYRHRGAHDDDDVEVGSAEKCVICLCDYEEGEETAVSLPTCKHNFHVACIGRWLQCHGRCPICSSSALPKLSAEGIRRSRAGVVSLPVFVDSGQCQSPAV